MEDGGTGAGPGGTRARRPSRRRLLGWSAGAGAAVVGLGAAGCSSSAAQGGGGNPGGSPAADSGPSAGTGASATARVSAPPATGVLAANYNQSLDAIDFGELEAVSASWVRCFYLMRNADRGTVADQPGMRRLLAAVDRGYGTVLTLKFNYDSGLPTPGGPEMRTALDRLDKVLAAAMDKVSILTIGNEPFYETAKADRESSRINEFYESLAQHVISYRDAHSGSGSRTGIYMGALTGLDKPAQRTPQTRRWMAFVGQNRSISGVDIHPHVASAAEAQEYVDYVRPWLRADQRFLATEFSLVQLWKAHLSDPAPSGFAQRYGLPAGTLVWQVIQDALNQPFSERKWNDFLDSCDWFRAHRNFLTEQMDRFRSTGKLAVAGYGISQDAAMSTQFGPRKTPWVLNSVFCPHTVQRGADGLPGRNLTWFDAFRSIDRRQG